MDVRCCRDSPVNLLRGKRGISRGCARMKRGWGKMSLEQAEITGENMGSAFEVHQTLGYGFLERVYQKATGVSVGLLINFGKESVKFKRLASSRQSAFHPGESAARKEPVQDAGGNPRPENARRRLRGRRHKNWRHFRTKPVKPWSPRR